MGLPGMFFSTVAIAAGAVMYWAITTTNGHGFRLSTVGVILMIVGGIGLVVSTIVYAMSRQSTASRNHTYDSQATDSLGRTTEVHQQTR